MSVYWPQKSYNFLKSNLKLFLVYCSSGELAGLKLMLDIEEYEYAYFERGAKVDILDMCTLEPESLVGLHIISSYLS